MAVEESKLAPIPEVSEQLETSTANDNDTSLGQLTSPGHERPSSPSSNHDHNDDRNPEFDENDFDVDNEDGPSRNRPSRSCKAEGSDAFLALRLQQKEFSGRRFQMPAKSKVKAKKPLAAQRKGPSSSSVASTSFSAQAPAAVRSAPVATKPGIQKSKKLAKVVYKKDTSFAASAGLEKEWTPRSVANPDRPQRTARAKADDAAYAFWLQEKEYQSAVRKASDKSEKIEYAVSPVKTVNTNVSITPRQAMAQKPAKPVKPAAKPAANKPTAAPAAASAGGKAKAKGKKALQIEKPIKKSNIKRPYAPAKVPTSPLTKKSSASPTKPQITKKVVDTKKLVQQQKQKGGGTSASTVEKKSTSSSAGQIYEVKGDKKPDLKFESMMFMLNIDSGTDKSKVAGLGQLDNPHLCTSPDTTVLHVKEYLIGRVLPASASNEVLITSTEILITCRGLVLAPDLTLAYVRKFLWPFETDLVLKYRKRHDLW